MRRAGLVVTVFACCAAVPRLVAAKVGPLDLRELVDASDVVVVARVDSVTVAPDKKKYDDRWATYPRVATARVLEDWLGGVMQTVTFSATKTSPCDTSYAEPGETVVLFLGPPGQDGVRDIVNYGEGRFPVEARDGVNYAELAWPKQFRLPGAIEVANPAQPLPDAFVELRTLERAVRGELTEGPVEPAPPPAPPDWLAPTGWPIAGGVIVLADLALAMVSWRLARRRRRRRLGGAARWALMLAGSATGAWLAGRQLDLLLALPCAATQPDIPIVHLAWPVSMLASGLLAWLAGEIAGGPSRWPVLGALGACVGCAAVLLWFLFDPPVALVEMFASIEPFGLDVPQTVLAGLAAVTGYEVLRGPGPGRARRAREE